MIAARNKLQYVMSDLPLSTSTSESKTTFQLVFRSNGWLVAESDNFVWLESVVNDETEIIRKDVVSLTKVSYSRMTE